MNKKGIAPLLLLTIAGIIAGFAIIAVFFFSSTFRYILIGIGFFIAFVYLLGQSFKSDQSFTRGKVLVLLIFFGIGLFFVFGSGYLQTARLC